MTAAVTRVAVIIPFYQREPGLLEHCLRSISAQDAADAAIDVIVVDDASPCDPGADIAAAGPLPAHISVRVLKRLNGGPAAARNMGLDAAKEADVIAFLDSDDSWSPQHIGRALKGLAAGADAYFCDHRGEDGSLYLPSTGFSRDIRDGRPPTEPGPDGVFLLGGPAVADCITREYLAHTSTLVYRTDRLGGLRMSELLRSAGEDHLFCIDLALQARKVAISPEWGAQLGSGVSIYASAFGWGREIDLRRRAFNLAALKMMRDRADWAPATRADIERRIREGRQTVGYLVLRLIATQRKINVSVLKFVWGLDRLTVLTAPWSPVAMALLSRRRSKTPASGSAH